MVLKIVKSSIKLQVAARKANPAPPVGPALGQHGVNIVEFCRLFNKRTENIEEGLPIPVVVTVYSDRSFTFIIKSPPVSVLLKKAAGIESGSSNPKTVKVGKITRVQIHEIAMIKSLDMTGATSDAMFRSILGSAFSMGLVLEEG